jgi:hypothetical protein
MWVTKERADFRQPLQLPLRFRILSDQNHKSIPSETANISPSGIFMHTPVRLKVGTALQLSIRIPLLVSGSNGFHFRCMGRVVHEQKFPGGDQGYGVRFERAASARVEARKALTEGFCGGEEGAAPFVEKRTSRRHVLNVGVRYRCLEVGFSNEESAAEIENFSWRGLFLTSEQIMEVGSLLSLCLESPEENAGNCSAQESAGRIVHRLTLADGRIGYGVQIEKQLLRMVAMGAGQ